MLKGPVHNNVRQVNSIEGSWGFGRKEQRAVVTASNVDEILWDIAVLPSDMSAWLVEGAKKRRTPHLRRCTTKNKAKNSVTRTREESTTKFCVIEENNNDLGEKGSFCVCGGLPVDSFSLSLFYSSTGSRLRKCGLSPVCRKALQPGKMGRVHEGQVVKTAQTREYGAKQLRVCEVIKHIHCNVKVD